MSSQQGQSVNIPRMDSTDSEKLTMTPPERKFSLTQMLGRRTSVGEAFKKYSLFTVNGDGFQPEDYTKHVQVQK